MDGLPEHAAVRIYGKHAMSDGQMADRFSSALTGEYVAGRTKALAFRGAKIVLNTMHYAEIRGINSRLFEATGCGGFVLSHTGPELASYYEPGVEVVTFNSPSELSDIVTYYLSATEERHRIAKAGQIRAHRDHTYPSRLRHMLKVVKFPGTVRQRSACDGLPAQSAVD
jgi:spore maturation protein CgeB